MMSAPDPLAELRPLHIPPPVSWWPPAPGWWLLAGLVLLVLALMGFYVHRTRMKRAALKELGILAASGRERCKLIMDLAVLLKRYAMFCYPTAGVAALTGEKWLYFLDEHGGNGEFMNGHGKVFGDELFRIGADPDADALIALVRRWIKVNRRRK